MPPITVNDLLALFDDTQWYRFDVCIDCDWLTGIDEEYLLNEFGDYDVAKFGCDFDDEIILEIYIEGE